MRRDKSTWPLKQLIIAASLCINLHTTKRWSNKAIFFAVLNILTILGGSTFSATTLIVDVIRFFSIRKFFCVIQQYLCYCWGFSTQRLIQTCHREHLILITGMWWEGNKAGTWMTVEICFGTNSIFCSDEMCPVNAAAHSIWRCTLSTNLITFGHDSDPVHTTSYLPHYLFKATAQLFFLLIIVLVSHNKDLCVILEKIMPCSW